MPKGFKINPKTGKTVTKPTIYTEEFVLSELEDITTQLLENKDIYLLGDVFETKPYHNTRYTEWAKDFSGNKQISLSIKRIKDILEFRINKKGLEGQLNSTLTIFNLKNNYDWKDKTEVDQTNRYPDSIKLKLVEAKDVDGRRNT